MEDEGIMALPQGQPQQPNVLSELPSADTYDAVLTGLRNNDPEQAAAVKAAAREAIADLDLSPQELDAVLNVLEYMARNPAEYTKLRQNLIDQDLMDPEDLPEQFDAEYLGTAIMVLNEAKMLRAENAQAVTEMAPQVEGLGPMPMAEGGLADVGRYLASYGRNGDTMLAHITPAEAAMLMRRGASGTVNPQTKLPEFFLKKLFKSIKKAVKSALKNPIVRAVATIALASFIGPHASSVVGAIAPAASAATVTAVSAALTSVATSAAVSAAAGEKIDPKSLLINAATSYFGAGGNIPGTSINPVRSIAGSDFLKNFGVTPGSSTATGIATGLTNAAIGAAAGMNTQQALMMGIQSGVMAGIQQSQVQKIKDLAKNTDDQLKNMGYSDSQIVNIRRNITPGKPVNPPKPVEAQSSTSTPAPDGTVGVIGSAADYVDPYSQEGGIFARGGPGTQGTAPIGAPSAGTTPAGGAPPATGGTSTASTYPTGLTTGQRFSRLLDSPSLENVKNFFLVNPNITEGIGRYVPAGLTLAGLGAVTGGFKDQPVDMNPAFDQKFTGIDYIRANPAMFASNLGRTEGSLPVYNPMVPYSEYSKLIAPPPPQPVYGMKRGGDPSKFPRKTGPINGPGTGTSDSIPAMLSDGEFVFTAKAVRNAGGGSRRKGAKRMYALMKKLEGGPVVKGDA